MSVTAENLLAPQGEIEAEFFPEEDSATLTARLEAYITEGIAKAGSISDADAATIAWAYHRAFKSIYTRLLAAPSSISVDGDGSASYLITQIRLFGELADQKLAEFNGLVSDAVVAASPPMASSSTANAFSW